MKMNSRIDNLYSKYRGNWVSISKDYSKVFAHSKNLDRLVEEIKKRNLRYGMIMKIPSKKYTAYVG